MISVPQFNMINNNSLHFMYNINGKTLDIELKRDIINSNLLSQNYSFNTDMTAIKNKINTIKNSIPYSVKSIILQTDILDNNITTIPISYIPIIFTFSDSNDNKSSINIIAYVSLNT